jgi:hypothetical protein
MSRYNWINCVKKGLLSSTPMGKIYLGIADRNVFALVSEAWTLLLRSSPPLSQSGNLCECISDGSVEIWARAYSCP